MMHLNCNVYVIEMHELAIRITVIAYINVIVDLFVAGIAVVDCYMPSFHLISSLTWLNNGSSVSSVLLY